MKLRPKIFSEFMLGIQIAYPHGGGVKIICKLKSYVLVDTKHKPWNTPDTRRTFLANLYIKEVLLKLNISNKIKRIKGFELLGKKCFYREELLTICSWKEMVDKETGEMTKQLTLAGRFLTPTPLKVFINEVQL